MGEYLVIGGYHDGEWHDSPYPEISLAEHEEVVCFAGDTAQANTNDLLAKVHRYQRHEYRFSSPYAGVTLTSAFIWAPIGQDIQDTMSKLIHGYKKAKGES